MKFTVYIKCPDALENAINTHIEENFLDLSEEEKKDKYAELYRWAQRRFVRYGECYQIEFDTEAQTATVKDSDA